MSMKNRILVAIISVLMSVLFFTISVIANGGENETQESNSGIIAIEAMDDNVSIELNKEYQLEVNVYPEDIPLPEISVENKVKGIVAVDENLKLTAIGVGLTILHLTTEDGLLDAEVRVSVHDLADTENSLAIIIVETLIIAVLVILFFIVKRYYSKKFEKRAK